LDPLITMGSTAALAAVRRVAAAAAISVPLIMMCAQIYDKKCEEDSGGIGRAWVVWAGTRVF
jgi:di/tricarboxylate transporter